MKEKKKNPITKRGDTWVGKRPVVFTDRKREAQKRQCRKKVTNW